MKNSSQDRISELEKQIISLQRELDNARRQSTSMWCKVNDLCTGLDFPKDVSEMLTSEISNIVKEWAKEQRSKISRRYSSLGSLPPYTDCLNDVIVSISNPEVEPELDPYSYEEGQESENGLNSEDSPSYDSYDLSAYNEGVNPRIPPPPPPNLVSSQGAMGGPPKMMRVNVPRGHTQPAPSPKGLPEA